MAGRPATTVEGERAIGVVLLHAPFRVGRSEKSFDRRERAVLATADKQTRGAWQCRKSRIDHQGIARFKFRDHGFTYQIDRVSVLYTLQERRPFHAAYRLALDNECPPHLQRMRRAELHRSVRRPRPNTRDRVRKPEPLGSEPEFVPASDGRLQRPTRELRRV